MFNALYSIRDLRLTRAVCRPQAIFQLSGNSDLRGCGGLCELYAIMTVLQSRGANSATIDAVAFTHQIHIDVKPTTRRSDHLRSRLAVHFGIVSGWRRAQKRCGYRKLVWVALDALGKRPRHLNTIYPHTYIHAHSHPSISPTQLPLLFAFREKFSATSERSEAFAE
jgi:hypothetical protein